MNRSLKELILIQFKGYWREPEVLFWTLGFPIMVATVLGLLYSFKPSAKFNAAVVYSQNIEKRTPTANEIIIPGKSSRKITFKSMDEKEAEDSYKHSKVDIIMKYDDPKNIIFYFDPANDKAENLYLWISNSLMEKESNLHTKISPLEQPGNRYIDYLVPGLIALGIMNATLWGIGWTLIEFRLKKFLRRMIATPMRKIDFMMAISFTRLTLSMIEAGILFVFAYLVFNVRMAGSFLSFGILFLAGHIAFSGLAVLMASRTNNTRVGNGLINITTMPMFLLSGVFFSYHSFPEWMVDIIRFIPLTVLADSMREVFIFGTDIFHMGFSVIYLVTFGLVFYVVGLRIYRWY